MGNVSLKEHSRHSRHIMKSRHSRHSRHTRHRRRGGMRSPSDDLDPRELIKRKMKANVTRRRIESKANNSDKFFLSKTPTRTRSKKPTVSAVIEEE